MTFDCCSHLTCPSTNKIAIWRWSSAILSTDEIPICADLGTSSNQNCYDRVSSFSHSRVRTIKYFITNHWMSWDQLLLRGWSDIQIMMDFSTVRYFPLILPPKSSALQKSIFFIYAVFSIVNNHTIFSAIQYSASYFHLFTQYTFCP